MRKGFAARESVQRETGLKVGRNICHGSDSVESANREIAHWFSKEELIDWTPATKGWTYE